ncbi:MAG: nitroreductase family protein [Liquorilactobacillus nagelii]|jgi:predicted oxidoreductase (fatty acid repression mutant protein)|uniref:nitroreductase family protein n=1 Tax=Liquorilactobacillus nagelii TaxID=82688 RepID=UPI001CCF2010|nr:nitroreductase family protein [Liquorilactobacillus nagelii]MCI1633613.1 nitroreductase family protein [Liquorilactobacillus nagelii]MCI1921450.1 nitroreductase family protein [Liquorilactobacillus nagelii]MCI1976620.1 nitroreductase family protein [Liquorilactobacillus nagelii]ULQ49738.1 nitroreductase family protein [Liquorilactobacillus nagelii]
MNQPFLDLLKKRRTIYNLGRNVTLEKDELTAIIKEAVRQSPTAFNNQSTRAIVLYGAASEKVWNIVADRLKTEVPNEAAYTKTKQKIATFKAGFGTVLLFTDQPTVKDHEEKFTLYADNFQDWSEQGLGGAQQNIWLALAANGLGASLQHYNPLIDDQIRQAFDVPTGWVLRAEMPFGSIEKSAGEKQFLADNQRFKVFDD